MDLRNLSVEWPILSMLEDMLDVSEEPETKGGKNNPSRTYVRDAKAMAATPADVVEFPDRYEFVVDMPGIKGSEMKVQVENENVLVVSGERKREKEKEEGVKYLRMERRVGKFMRKFVIPDNADKDAISAVTQDGVCSYCYCA